MKAPFHQKRHDIVIGTYEPIDADLPEKAVTVAIATSVPTVVPIAVPIAVTTAVTAPPEVVVPTIPDTSKGIPDFWLQVFRNCSFVSEMITENDEPAIKHLVDIRTTQEDLKGFTLEFEFSDNEFFTDKILVKKYITSDNEYSDDSTFEKAEGTKINWKPGKDLTHRTIQKKAKAGKRGRGRGQAVTVTEKVESFFNFFEPIEVPDEPVDEQEAEQLETDMEIDFDIGREIKDRVIPHAVLWFTGEAALLFADDYDLADDMFGYEDDDDGEVPPGSDDEDSGEEHHHGGSRGRGRGAAHLEDSPPQQGRGGGRGGRGRGGKPAAASAGAGVNEPPPQQCKQQ